MSHPHPLENAYGYRNSLTSLLEDGPDFKAKCPAPDLQKSGTKKEYELSKPIFSPEGKGEDELVAIALEALEAVNIDYGDLRLGRERTRLLSLQDTSLKMHHQRESVGIGIRVWHQGSWGFAATGNLSRQSINHTVNLAAEKARTASKLRDIVFGRPVPPNLLWPSPLGSQTVEFHTPVLECPFLCDTSRLLGLMLAGATQGLEMPAIRRVESSCEIYGRRRIFANTLGFKNLTTHCILDASQKFIAVENGQSAYRTVESSALAGGVEHLESAYFADQARRAAFEARLKCLAPKPLDGRYDLILDPHNMGLTIHESVGHPTELDRVMGYELGFAGGSFARLEDLGKLRYGSPLVHFSCNNNLLFGPASTGFDDEGTLCQKTPIVKDGILVGFGTSLETAGLSSLAPNGNCRSTSWGDAPIVRIPNLFLEPGATPLTMKELISNTEKGIVLLGRDSFSIDQMRSNFQFGSDMAYLIENGKVVSPLRDVIYQSLTTDFWQSLDAVCDQSEWQMHGVFNCGKGQPMQLGKMLHGGSPARFRGIKVGY